MDAGAVAVIAVVRPSAEPQGYLLGGGRGQ